MANNIEWAHTSAPAQTMTPLELYRADPHSPMLDTEIEPWGAAILTGDASVAIYADSPIELLEWLEARASEVRTRIYKELSSKPTFTVERTPAATRGKPEQAIMLHTGTDRSAALWHYFEADQWIDPDDHLELIEHPVSDTASRTLAHRGDAIDNRN